jgi:hypothetical protein
MSGDNGNTHRPDSSARASASPNPVIVKHLDETDPVIDAMFDMQFPITREVYLDLRFPEGYEFDAEIEASMPWEMRAPDHRGPPPEGSFAELDEKMHDPASWASWAKTVGTTPEQIIKDLEDTGMISCRSKTKD